MRWTQHPVTIVVALAASMIAVATSPVGGSWWWFGLATGVYNAVVLVRWWRRRRRERQLRAWVLAGGPADSPVHERMHAQIARDAGRSAPAPEPKEVWEEVWEEVSVHLVEVLDDPAVAAALDAGPREWQRWTCGRPRLWARGRWSSTTSPRPMRSRGEVAGVESWTTPAGFLGDSAVRRCHLVTPAYCTM